MMMMSCFILVGVSAHHHHQVCVRVQRIGVNTHTNKIQKCPLLFLFGGWGGYWVLRAILVGRILLCGRVLDGSSQTTNDT
jgi:hypothetical protein